MRFQLRACAALALVAWLALPAAPTHAAILTVTKTADTNDGNCDADCSLREAVVAGNAVSGSDTIEIPAGYYRLTIPGNDDAAAQGDLDITSELTLKAVGPATIDAGGIDRVVNVRSTGNATLSGLWITGGKSPVGGIDNEQGTVTIINSTVSGNEAQVSGGGIFNSGTMTLTNSRVTDNTAASSGAGIQNSSVNPVTLTKSIVSGNHAGNDGGGIYNFLGEITLNKSTVSSNEGDNGAGIYNIDTANVIKSTVSGNVCVSGGGGGIYSGGTLNVTSSTVSGNCGNGNAGGIYNNGGSLNLTSSTLSGNTATGSGGGIYNSSAGTATITDATITGNRADSDNNGGDGGGVFRSSGTISIVNSILAGNTDGTGTNHPDCSGTITSNDNNIIGDTTGCTVTAQANDDFDVAVVLGPLAFNGGPTETHALPTGSVALDHGPIIGTSTDQRGVPRPVGAAFDTGAYEQAFCSTLLVNVVGTNGKDILTGTALADGVLALGGNDTVRAGDNNDKVCGGDGKDLLFGEKGNDKLLGEAGNDTLDGGPGTDVCVGGPGTNKLKSC